MHIDRVRFLAFTSLLAGCAPQTQQGQDPRKTAALPQETPARVVTPIFTTPIPSASPVPPAPEGAPGLLVRAAPSAGQPSLPATDQFYEAVVRGNRCIGCEWDTVSDPAQKITGPALDCFRFPLPAPSCEGVEPMCHELVSPLTDDVAKRAIACLRARASQQTCEFQRVHKCVDKAIRKTNPRDDTQEPCTEIVGYCSQRSKSLPIDDCRRFLSSLRYCEYLDSALVCLADRCSVRDCLGME